MATELPTVSEPERAERCETCRWWVQKQYKDNKVYHFGHCHKYAPSGSHADHFYNWPKTRIDDFCGEWQAK